METPVFMIKHKYTGRFIIPEGEESDPDNWTDLVVDDKQHERMYFTFDVIEDVWGYIRHVTSGKIFHPYDQSLHPSNNSKVVLHSDRHAAALFAIDQVNDLMIHKGGQGVNTKGADPNPKRNTCVRLRDTEDDAGKWLFVSPQDPDKEVLVYGSPTLTGEWNIIHMVLNPVAEHISTVEIKHGMSTNHSSRSTFQFDWEIEAKASLLFSSVSKKTALSGMVQNTTSSTWSEETSVTKEIKVAPGQSVVTWQFLFTGEQSGNKAVFQSTLLADTDSPNVKPALPSDTQEDEAVESPAKKLISECEKLRDTSPALYKIPFQKPDEDTKNMIRTFEFGSSKIHDEKTIMVFGTTGSDKGALIEGLINHVFGVRLTDNFRFKAMDTEADQMDWITRYRIHPLTEAQTCILNIIDIPEFGGTEKDQNLVCRIREIVTTSDGNGLETIDVLWFVAEATPVSLDDTQLAMLGEIRSIFGNEIEDHIVAVVTGGNGNNPPVLNALSQAQISTNHQFVFNNAALFTLDTENESNRSVSMFWDMCARNYDAFLGCLSQMAPVVVNKEQIKTTIQTLRPQIDQGLMELETIRKDGVRLEISEMVIIEDITYDVDELRINKIPLTHGLYVTNCVVCHMTCHYPCQIPDDAGKRECWAMTGDYCRICPKKCFWNHHRNNDYRIETEVVTVQKTYTDMKVVYGITEQENVSKETLAQAVRNKFHEGKDVVLLKLGHVRRRTHYLEAEDINDDQLPEAEFIDTMIQVEEQVEGPGFKERVKILTILRKIVDPQTAAMDDPDELLRQIGFYEE